MTAILTETSHGEVASLTTAYNALKAGRTAAGFGTSASGQNQLIYDDATTTQYNQIYKFSNGTGAYADTYIKLSNSTNTHLYQQGQAPSLTSGNPNGGLITAGSAFPTEMGVGGQQLFLYTTSRSYRSLSFKPVSGTDYGVHIYQQYDTGISDWRTVLAEAFFKASNKPSSFNEGLAPSTVFMYGYGRAYQMGGALNVQTAYDRFSWRYTDQPYANWSASPTNCINTLSAGRSQLALLCKSGFPTSYGYYGGLNILGETFNTSVSPYTTTGTEAYKAQTHNIYYDWMAHLCEPVRYGVADLVGGTTAKLAGPFVLTNRSLDVGTANTNDVFLGPEFAPGTVLEVSASEKYTSAFGHIYMRTT